ncbi:MAG: HNH endonuclease [Actinomycetota bacterium]|nr:HNH endonuclease [Actinomycetota bacterium]
MKLRIGDRSQCWPWMGSRIPFGHGRFAVDGRLVAAHRFAYELLVGPIPEGLCVLHRCDNPPCCNPDHLFLGTIADNNADMIAKGRQVVLAGELNGRALLTEAQVEEIRWRHAAGETQVALAHAFGVDRMVVVYAVLGKSWRHVPGPIIRRGRIGPPPRIPVEAVRTIRSRYERGGVTQLQLAQEYGIAQATVSKLVRGERRAVA